MSFQDLESGSARPLLGGSSSSSPTAADAQFSALQSALGMQVFKINANVQGIAKLVDQLGTARDTGAVRGALHDLTETTREMAKRGSEDVKRLAALQQGRPHLKTALAKTQHDFQLSLVAFQKAQQLSVARQRTVVEGVKLAVDDDVPLEHTDSARAEPEQRQAQLLQQQFSPQELQHQESLIVEREAEIREIESGIHELHEIFRDLGTLVTEQGGMIDSIESNISNVAADTHGVANELTQASTSARPAGAPRVS